MQQLANFENRRYPIIQSFEILRILRIADLIIQLFTTSKDVKRDFDDTYIVETFRTLSDHKRILVSTKVLTLNEI